MIKMLRYYVKISCFYEKRSHYKEKHHVITRNASSYYEKNNHVIKREKHCVTLPNITLLEGNVTMNSGGFLNKQVVAEESIVKMTHHKFSVILLKISCAGSIFSAFKPFIFKRSADKQLIFNLKMYSKSNVGLQFKKYINK